MLKRWGSCSVQGVRQRTDVVVVGAGLAGLSCALHCAELGLSVTLLESSDRPGGRVRTDVVEGYRLDRGFQVFNTAYPEAARVLDLGALRLSAFTPGAAVYREGRTHLFVNPLRRPRALATTLRSPLGTLRGKAVLGLVTALAAAAPATAVSALLRRLAPAQDTTTARLVEHLGLGQMELSFLRPFLRGVLLDDQLSATSARFAALVWRSFARGRTAVPALGMGEIPAQLAARIPEGALRTHTPVRAVGNRAGTCHVDLESGERIVARAVVVATDPTTADRLIPGRGAGSAKMRGVTTFWHRAPIRPLDEPLLVLDGEESLVLNSVVMSNVSPCYLPTGSTHRTEGLVATSVLGSSGGRSIERAVRRRLSALYSTATEPWDLLAVQEIAHALPSFAPGCPLRKTVRLGAGLYVCGDHRDTPSIQGALVSGRRAAGAVAADLGVSPRWINSPAPTHAF